MAKDGYGLKMPDWRDIVFFQSGKSDINFLQKSKGEKMDLKDKVIETIENFCDCLQSFTSLDISNKIKQDVNFDGARHREVASLVRTIYADGLMDDFGFERALIDVVLSNGNTAQAYLYHHQSVSASSYDRRSQVAIPPALAPVPVYAAPFPAPVSNTIPTTNATVQVVNSDRQVRKQKRDHRLEVPASWVKHLGWDEGGTIYVVHQTDIVLKTSDQVNPNDTILTTTTISDGRLRVPKTAFAKAGFNSGRHLDHEVVLENDHVVVKDA